MEIGMIGLGRMGMNMARRLLAGKIQVAAYNRTAAKTKELAGEGAVACFSLEELVERLKPPRAVWLMLPAGQPVDAMLSRLAPLLTAGDMVIDGGNSCYRDDVRRAEELATRGIDYLDVGVSGGIWGLRNGYCLMVGGPRPGFARLLPVFQALAPPDGYLYCGATGAGHYVKMIHNGIEYGMMQAYGEGFALLDASPYGEGLEYAAVARLWNRGSVIRSWLLELLENAFGKDPRLGGISGYVEDSGEGRWTVEEAVRLGVAAPVITLSLFERFQSRQENGFGNRVLAALRREFGGHAVRTAEPVSPPAGEQQD